MSVPSPEAEEYLRVIEDFALRFEDEEKWYEILDVLWSGLDEENCKWVEEKWENRVVPHAPEALGMVDVETVRGERMPPRRAVGTGAID